MTQTAPCVLSFQNVWENACMRAICDGTTRAAKSRPALLGLWLCEMWTETTLLLYKSWLFGQSEQHRWTFWERILLPALYINIKILEWPKWLKNLLTSMTVNYQKMVGKVVLGIMLQPILLWSKKSIPAENCYDQQSAVQRVDATIHCINHHPLGNSIGFNNSCLVI